MQKRWIACFLALLMILGLFACRQPAANEPNETVEQPTTAPVSEPTEPPAAEPEPEPAQPDPILEEYFLPKEEGMNQLTVYWKTDSINYATSDMWMWFPGKDGRGYEMHPCAYGA